MFDFVFGNSKSLNEVSSGSYKTEAALQAAVVAAMAAAVALSAFTCNVTVSSYSGQDVNNVLRSLADNNFIASLSGSTLTITW